MPKHPLALRQLKKKKKKKKGKGGGVESHKRDFNFKVLISEIEENHARKHV